jgi:DNA modification methylase
MVTQPPTTAPRILPPTNRQPLSDLLPWGYTYKDLKNYSKKTDFDNLKDWEGEKIKEKFVREKFVMLEKHTEYYIDFQEPPKKKFELEYRKLQNKFYRDRPAVMEFKALVNQYYTNPGKLLDNFSGMWEFMMACFVLINRVMSVEKEEDFVEIMKKYNESAEYLFYFVEWFEEKLISEKIDMR